jgi:hypothetical protein
MNLVDTVLGEPHLSEKEETYDSTHTRPMETGRGEGQAARLGGEERVSV